MPPADDANRLHLLETARRLFHEQGFHATSTATIVRESGLTNGTLFHYFRTKDDLLIGVLQHYVGLLRPVIMDPTEAAVADPVERIFSLLDRYRAGLESLDFKMGCPIGNLALEVGDDHPGARELIDLNFRNWSASIEAWLRAAQDRFPEGTDLAALAGFVLTVMEGSMMRARAARSLAPWDESVAQLRTYLGALQAARRTPAPPSQLTP
jgi:TetR/AcrR family transcriptional repressor of nem operon